MHVGLETDRLIVRRFTTSDVDDLVDLDGDPQVMHFINGGKPTQRLRVESKLLPMYLPSTPPATDTVGGAAIEKSSAEFLGSFHLRPAPDRAPDEPELGYRLRSSAWGHGYASEGSRALIDSCFAELGAQRVVAQTMVVNLASRRVLEKVGMRPVRTFLMEWPDYIAGSEDGDVEYDITRNEWEQQTQARTES